MVASQVSGRTLTSPGRDQDVGCAGGTASNVGWLAAERDFAAM
jgi:hypothetical protein